MESSLYRVRASSTTKGSLSRQATFIGNEGLDVLSG